MSYRLDLSVSPEQALQRAATERLEHAIGKLDDAGPGERDKAIHTARKDVKKTRALLRLHRSGLGRERFKYENAALRDAARRLSDLRDARVMIETVDALAERFVGQQPAAAFDALRDRVAESPTTADATDDARGELAAAAARVSDWHLDGDGADAVVEGLRRAYARGRTAGRDAEHEPTDEHLHDWRKRVKDLRHQQELLRNAWPGVLAAQADEAKALADLLGDDHDLTMLADRAGDDPAFAPLRELVDQRRAELQAAAFRLGRRIYAESPKRFTKRIAGWIGQARDEAPAELAA